MDQADFIGGGCGGPRRGMDRGRSRDRVGQFAGATRPGPVRGRAGRAQTLLGTRRNDRPLSLRRFQLRPNRPSDVQPLHLGRAPLWREAYRVLVPGGRLLAGFVNPVLYLFDPDEADRGELRVRYSIPFSDVTSLPPEEWERRKSSGQPAEFGHSLESQIGGQLAGGFKIAGFYEDTYNTPVDRYIPTHIATLSVK
jgi:hypothetical protein